MKRICAITLLLNSVLWPQVAAAEQVEPTIPYKISRPAGELIYEVDGKRAYEGLLRGTFDREPMREVIPRKHPSPLPPPTVVQAASPLFYIQLNRLEKEGPKLTGEDLVFKTIAEDAKKERCLIFGEECSALEIIEQN